MTVPTSFLDLSWASPLLAGLIALMVWLWSLAHLPLIGSLFWRVALTVLCVLLNTTPCGIIKGAHQAFVWLLTLWLLGWAMTIFPGRGGTVGGWLRGLPSRVLTVTLRIGRAILWALGRKLQSAIFPSFRKKTSGSKDGRE